MPYLLKLDSHLDRRLLAGLRQYGRQFARRKPDIQRVQREPWLLKLDRPLDWPVLAQTVSKRTAWFLKWECCAHRWWKWWFWWGLPYVIRCISHLRWEDISRDAKFLRFDTASADYGQFESGRQSNKSAKSL